MNPHLARQVLIARQLLSAMPDDVFTIYIVPLIQGHGWPFNISGLPTDLAEARRWFQMFDLQSVQTISQLSWERHEFPFAFGLFHSRSQQVVTMLIEHNTGVQFHAGIANVANTQAKFFGARDYIARTGRMPRLVVLQRDPFGLRILDGNHRLAAMASFNNAASGIVDCWLGTHSTPNR